MAVTSPQETGFQVEVATHYTPELGVRLGWLITQGLSDKYDGSPVPEARIRALVDDPGRDLLLLYRKTNARPEAAAGMAIMTRVDELDRSYAYMGGLVVEPELQGTGAANVLYEGLCQWARDRELPYFDFTSDEERRPRAGRFYDKMGAQRRSTVRFRMHCKEKE